MHVKPFSGICCTRRLVRALLLSGFVAVAGCNDTSDDTGDGSPISIADAYVIDSDGVTRRSGSHGNLDPAPIGSESFSLHWTVQGGQTPIHRADWFVSADAVLQPDPIQPGVDVRILGRNCGSGFSDTCLENIGDAGCEYRTDATVYCAELGALADRQPTALAAYFASTHGLPGDYFLILRIQDPSNGDTVVRSFPVTFY